MLMYQWLSILPLMCTASLTEMTALRKNAEQPVSVGSKIVEMRFSDPGPHQSSIGATSGINSIRDNSKYSAPLSNQDTGNGSGHRDGVLHANTDATITTPAEKEWVGNDPNPVSRRITEILSSYAGPDQSSTVSTSEIKSTRDNSEHSDVLHDQDIGSASGGEDDVLHDEADAIITPPADRERMAMVECARAFTTESDDMYPARRRKRARLEAGLGLPWERYEKQELIIGAFGATIVALCYAIFILAI